MGWDHLEELKGGKEGNGDRKTWVKMVYKNLKGNLDPRRLL